MKDDKSNRNKPTLLYNFNDASKFFYKYTNLQKLEIYIYNYNSYK